MPAEYLAKYLPSHVAAEHSSFGHVAFCPFYLKHSLAQLNRVTFIM